MKYLRQYSYVRLVVQDYSVSFGLTFLDSNPWWAHNVRVNICGIDKKTIQGCYTTQTHNREEGFTPKYEVKYSLSRLYLN